MIRKRPRDMRRLVLFLGFGGLGMVLLVSLVLVWGLGREVLIIAPHDPEVVELNRRLFLPGEDVASLYGNPLSTPIRIVLPDGDKLIRPVEDTSLLLLPVDKSAGENPLQARTVWLFARYLAGAFLVLGLAGLFLPRQSGLTAGGSES